MRNRTFPAGIVPVLLWLMVTLNAQIRVYTSEEAHLGVIARNVSQEDMTRLKLPREIGVYVEAVLENTPAWTAGLQSSDVLLDYAGIPLLSVRHLQRLVAESPRDRPVELTVFRNGRVLQKEVRIESRRASETVVGPVEEPLSWGQPMGEIPVDPRLSNQRFFFFFERPVLGMTGADLTDQLAEYFGIVDGRGVLVVEVFENSPAHRAGLRAGDVIVSVDGERIDTLHELSVRLQELEHELQILRGGESRRTQVWPNTRSR